MIKAEVIEYPGAEVPNWVTKCKDVLTSIPTIGTVAVVIVVALGAVVWHGRQASVASSTDIQSQPAASSTLQVTPLPATPLSPSTTPSATQPSAPVTESPATGNSSSSVGPAPAASLNSLQPSNSSQSSAQVPAQAVGQTLQSAGKATLDSLENLNL